VFVRIYKKEQMIRRTIKYHYYNFSTSPVTPKLEIYLSNIQSAAFRPVRIIVLHIYKKKTKDLYSRNVIQSD
jgi:hypothetical protein